MALDNIVIGGDFNLTLNCELDRFNSKYNNHKATKVLKSGMNELQLVDVWRDRNPEESRYSWFKRNPSYSASRIDMMLINQGLASNVIDVDYCYSCKSDHSMVTIEVQVDIFERGPGIWKLNFRLLANDEYCEGIEEVMRKCKNTNKVTTNPFSNTWETIKCECAEYSNQFAKQISSKKKSLLLDLYLWKEVLEKEIGNQNDGFYLVNRKIEELESERCKSSAFRARCNWERYGCKSSKYFFSLEKCNYGNKTMFTVILDDGSICKSQKRILDKQVKFYEELYQKDPKIDFTVSNDSDTCITDEHYKMLKTPISEEELSSAVKSLPFGKVAGSDGLPIEFYVKFWSSIAKVLKGVYDEVLTNGELTRTMKKGVMTLIPKKNKDTRKICNLRPLTMLNLDYKVLAKLLATQLKLVMPDIVKSEQTGFMENRQLHDNVRKMTDIIVHVNQTKKRAVIVSIDFEKCFDRIEHASIFAALKFFGFPEIFVKWT